MTEDEFEDEVERRVAEHLAEEGLDPDADSDRAMYLRQDYRAMLRRNLLPAEPVTVTALAKPIPGPLERFQARNRARRAAKETMDFSPLCYLATMCWNGFNHREALKNANLATTDVSKAEGGGERSSDPYDRTVARFGAVIGLTLSPLGIAAGVLFRAGQGVYLGVQSGYRRFNSLWYGESDQD